MAFTTVACFHGFNSLLRCYDPSFLCILCFGLLVWAWQSTSPFRTLHANIQFGMKIIDIELKEFMATFSTLPYLALTYNSECNNLVLNWGTKTIYDYIFHPSVPCMLTYNSECKNLVLNWGTKALMLPHGSDIDAIQLELKTSWFASSALRLDPSFRFLKCI